MGGAKVATHDYPIPQGFSSFLLKPYIKAVTHLCEVEWWRALMVECVTLIDYIIKKRLHIPPSKLSPIQLQENVWQLFFAAYLEHEYKLQKMAMFTSG